MSLDTAGNNTRVGVAVSGASTIAAADARSLFAYYAAAYRYQMSSAYVYTGLTAGSNTFTMQYKVSAGTGTFLNRHIIVFPLGL